MTERLLSIPLQMWMWHLRAKASKRVVFPDPFSPIKKVTGDENWILGVAWSTLMLKGYWLLVGYCSDSNLTSFRCNKTITPYQESFLDPHTKVNNFSFSLSMNMKRWYYPVFIACHRGKSLPRLHKARVEAIRVDAHKRFWNSGSLIPMQSNPKRLGRWSSISQRREMPSLLCRDIPDCKILPECSKKLGN